MDIQELRHSTGMTQKEFSAVFGIPIGTIRNWEQGISSPPEYVFSMILSSIRRDIMINVETIKLIGIMKELAKRSQNGICDFEEATQDNYCRKVFFDKNATDKDGHYRVVADSCVIDDKECYHHDVISYWDDLGTGFTIRAMKDEDEEYFIEVCMSLSGVSFVIENGDWYCSSYS